MSPVSPAYSRAREGTSLERAGAWAKKRGWLATPESARFPSASEPVRHQETDASSSYRHPERASEEVAESLSLWLDVLFGDTKSLCLGTEPGGGDGAKVECPIELSTG